MKELSRRDILIFALAIGAAVANIYYIQPLVQEVGQDFEVSDAAAGMLNTFAQTGYLVGLALIVPLGDIVDQRKLTIRMMALAAVGLACTAIAPTYWIAAVALIGVGLTSAVVQVLVPFAASLSSDAQRARTLGVLMAGLLSGSLLGRALAGGLTAVGGWRTIYWVAAALMGMFAIVLARVLPSGTSRTAVRYAELLRSSLVIFKEEPVIRWRSLFGALGFGGLIIFWTSLPFLLSDAPYKYDETVIGLFALLGFFGAAGSVLVGRFINRFGTHVITGCSFLAVAAGFALVGLAPNSLGALIVGLLLIDVAAPAIHITNQTVIYARRPESRSRITTIYSVSSFFGGVVGSASSALAYSLFGWTAVAVLGASFCAIALVVWLAKGAVALGESARA